MSTLTSSLATTNSPTATLDGFGDGLGVSPDNPGSVIGERVVIQRGDKVRFVSR